MKACWADAAHGDIALVVRFRSSHPMLAAGNGPLALCFQWLLISKIRTKGVRIVEAGHLVF